MKAMQLNIVLCALLGVFSLSVGTSNAGSHVEEAMRVAASTKASVANDRDEQRINPQGIPTSKAKILLARSTSYNKDESGSDEDTKKKKTSTLVTIDTMKAMRLGAVAVDPRIIPYGSVIVTPDNMVYVAVDTGSAVVSRKASREYASKLGLPGQSREYQAPVLDFYAYGQVGQYWDYFRVVRYEGRTPFRDLKQTEKNEYLRTLSHSFFPRAIARI